MKKRSGLILAVALVLMASGAGLLTYLRAHQKLGAPAVRTSPIEGSRRLQVDLPELVGDYTSDAVPEDKTVLDVLPQDTSFGQRLYKAPDGFQVLLNVVLMGSDRTSLHKPQICLRGTGWNIDRADKEIVNITRPAAYDLPVMKLSLSPEKPENRRGVYVYWFAADQEYTREHWQRMWWMFRDLLKTGVLQRWSYITYFAQCAPGQEEATFERIKKLIADSAPDFQIPPKRATTTAFARP